MKIDNKEIMNSILKSISKLGYIDPDDLPNIHLYMDQVTTFMDAQLESTKRHPQDKILTKTMINNYAKNRLLPPPEKKKYGKEHLLLLIFIYYFKNILSINDIQSLLGPITNKYFENKDGWNLKDIYTEVFSMEKSQIEYLEKDLIKRYHVAGETFPKLLKKIGNICSCFLFSVCSASTSMSKKCFWKKFWTTSKNAILLKRKIPPGQRKEKRKNSASMKISERFQN